MLPIIVPFVYCLAVSGVASDYAEPNRDAVHLNNAAQNNQNIQGAYYNSETHRSQQDKPCARTNQLGDVQVAALPVQNVNQAQNKENSYKNTQQTQNQKVNNPSNYPVSGYEQANYNQQKNLNSGTTIESPLNTENVAQQVNARYPVSQTKVNDFENVANAVKAVNQLKQNKYESEYAPPHFNNPVENKNSANSKTQNVPNQKKQVRSEKPFNVPYYDDDELLSTQHYDTRHLNKGQGVFLNNDNTGKKGETVKNCQTLEENNQSNEQEQERIGEEELYAFIVSKQNEERTAGKPSQANKYAQGENDDENDEPQFFLHNQNNKNGPFNKKQRGQVRNQAKNQVQQQKNVNENNGVEDNDDEDEVTANTANANVFPQHKSLAKYENSESGPSSQNQRVKQKQLQKLQQQQRQKQWQQQQKKNKAAPKSLEEENPDEYKDDDDDAEDYNEDVDNVQSRRNNPQNVQNQLQRVNNKNNQDQALQNNNDKVQRKQVQQQNAPNQQTDVEDVDVTARAGRGQKVLIGEHTRVCYACSSASNPTCHEPNRQTTVKYCRRGHDSCVTKIFKADGIQILTRDCGTTCNDNVIPGVTPTYSKCSVCHTDLCNGAYSLNGQNLFFICTLAAVAVTKYFM